MDASSNDAPRSSRYRDLVVVGASAGGTQALREIVSGLPAELPAALLVVQHTASNAPGMLPGILARAGSLPAKLAEDGEPIERGQIYVAPPDRHLLCGSGEIAVSRGPRENGHRPAVDPLFRSAARRYGRRVIAVVLSGGLDDGTAGLIAVKARGGISIVQDPDEALHGDMPTNAIRGDSPDHIVPVAEVADLICDLVQQRLEPEPPQAETPERVPLRWPLNDWDSSLPRMPNTATGVTCPECGGPLFDREEGDLVTFECLVGHRYSSASLDSEQARQLEKSLWTAARSLVERADLLRRLAARVRQRGVPELATRYEATAESCEDHAAAIRTAIDQLGSRAHTALATPQEPADQVS